MSGLDMSEAIRMLANEKNITVDALLHVMVDALATQNSLPSGSRRTAQVSGFS